MDFLQFCDCPVPSSGKLESVLMSAMDMQPMNILSLKSELQTTTDKDDNSLPSSYQLNGREASSQERIRKNTELRTQAVKHNGSICLLIHSFFSRQYILRTYYVPKNVLCEGNTRISKTDQALALTEFMIH